MTGENKHEPNVRLQNIGKLRHDASTKLANIETIVAEDWNAQGDEIAEAYKKINAEAQAVLKMVKEILDLSKGEKDISPK
jgi:hypothetical protein